MEILEANISVAEFNLWVCAVENPVYPFLAALNNLMDMKGININLQILMGYIERAIKSMLVVCSDESPGNHFFFKY